MMQADLRRIAEAADNGNHWEWEGGYPQRISRVGDVVVVADCFEDPDSPSRFAEFVATFDPPTVLAMIDVVESALELRIGIPTPRKFQMLDDALYVLLADRERAR